MLASIALATAAAVGAPPPHWQHGAFMEIFVRAYADSDGDGIGDLKGLTSRLDYLKDLGVKGLWLMPITASADHDHGYAVQDHRALEPAYGTPADLDELLRQAHRRGIGVVMDYVVNHAAAQHPWFQSARTDRNSPWKDWWVFADTHPEGWRIFDQDPWYATGDGRWYFGAFSAAMPDFNLRHAPAWQYHEDSLRGWLARGIDGFRLDAMPHLVENDATRWNDQPESRALAKRLQDLVHERPNRFLVCEAVAEPQAWGDPAVCGSAFAFGLAQHFAQAALGQPASVAALAEYYRNARPTMATFASNHDLFAGRRLWDQVAGDETAYRLAAAGYLLQPGTPFIYYGEEVGQAGLDGVPGDPSLRGPMSWDATGQDFSRAAPFRPLAPNRATHNATQRGPGSLHAFYKAMLALRNGRPSIARGSFEHAFADDRVLGFQRRLGRETTLVLINYGEARHVEVPGLAPLARLRTLYPRRAAAGFELPARSVRVIDVR